MNTVKLEISEDSMDALFVDLLNDNLETILYTDVGYIHPDDYDYNTRLAQSIMTLMMYQKETHAFDRWYDDVYVPMLTKYREKYEELIAKEE